MKVFIAICSFCLVLANAKISDEFKKQLGEAIAEVGAKCAEKENVSEDDIFQIGNKDLPSSQGAKCMLSCMNQEFELQEADGKFTENSVKAALEDFKKEDADFHGKLETTFIACIAEVKSDDRCEAAFEMEKCFREKAEAAGINEDEWF